MSAAIACSDFLQTSGKLPASLTMPPFWPPMPSAQVLQAFLLRIACQSFHTPPIWRDFLRAYRMARHPPPLRRRFIDNVCHLQGCLWFAQRTTVSLHGDAEYWGMLRKPQPPTMTLISFLPIAAAPRPPHA